MKGNTGLLKQENNEKVAYGECLGIVWKEQKRETSWRILIYILLTFALFECATYYIKLNQKQMNRHILKLANFQYMTKLDKLKSVSNDHHSHIEKIPTIRTFTVHPHWDIFQRKMKF